MAEKLVTQDILAYDMGVLWAIADRHQGIFSEEMIEYFCRGLAAPTSLVSVCDLLVKLAGRHTEMSWGEAAVALALAGQKDPTLTLNRLTILAYLSDRVNTADLADLLMAFLILGLPVSPSISGLERPQAQLRAAGKIVEMLDLPASTLEVPARLLYAASPESADVVATEFANGLPDSMKKAVLHDICLFAPFLSPEGLVIPSETRLDPISPQGGFIQDLLKVDDPFLAE
jgi:hypothetical protein